MNQENLDQERIEWELLAARLVGEFPPSERGRKVVLDAILRMVKDIYRPERAEAAARPLS